jgi:hypothetical protein
MQARELGQKMNLDNVSEGAPQVAPARPAYGVWGGTSADVSTSDHGPRRLVQQNTVESGTRLADRYRLEECLQGGDAFTTWRAVDEKLSRAVGVHVLASNHPRAEAVIQAAQAAAVLNDRRFCQVFDVSKQDEVTYVVEECSRPARSPRSRPPRWSGTSQPRWPAPTAPVWPTCA